MIPERDWTEKQGQYLAFIYNYTVIHGEPPSERDMQWFFRVTPPTVHQMVLKLEELGFISWEPGKARTIQVLVAPEGLPDRNLLVGQRPIHTPSRVDDEKKPKALDPCYHWIDHSCSGCLWG